MDVYEEKDNVVVKAEIPGLPKENVQVSLTDTTITLSGEKKKEEEAKEHEYAYSERTYGKFSRNSLSPMQCEIRQGKGHIQRWDSDSQRFLRQRRLKNVISKSKSNRR